MVKSSVKKRGGRNEGRPTSKSKQMSRSNSKVKKVTKTILPEWKRTVMAGDEYLEHRHHDYKNDRESKLKAINNFEKQLADKEEKSKHYKAVRERNARERERQEREDDEMRRKGKDPEEERQKKKEREKEEKRKSKTKGSKKTK